MSDDEWAKKHQSSAPNKEDRKVTPTITKLSVSAAIKNVIVSQNIGQTRSGTHQELVRPRENTGAEFLGTYICT